jgi:transposase InsO family protein
MKKTKTNPKNKVNELMKKLNIDETYTKSAPKYKFDKVKQNTFPMQDYNFMMDTMELPKTKLGYKHLLTVVDLWSDEVDFEPLKGLTAKEALEAFKKIIKRPHLNLPKGSIRSDNGGEFKGVFDAFLKEQKILHRFSLEYRHKQNANVENLNSMLGRILMTYLTNKEIKIDKPYNEWTDILPLVRKELNKMRKKPDGNPFNLETIPFNMMEPKYKVGDIVIRKYEKPHNARGYQEQGRFRKGDLRWDVKNKLKIVKVLNYPNNNRYILSKFPNVSYAEAEIKKADVDEEYLEVNRIIDKKKEGNIVYYKVWWLKELKSKATWEKETQLREDGLDDYIEFYENQVKKDAKKKKK